MEVMRYLFCEFPAHSNRCGGLFKRSHSARRDLPESEGSVYFPAPGNRTCQLQVYGRATAMSTESLKDSIEKSLPLFASGQITP